MTTTNVKFKFGTNFSSKETGTIYFDKTNHQIYVGNNLIVSGTLTSITAGTGLNTVGATTVDGGTITSSGTLYLTKTGITAGTYQGLTIDAYGRITNASNQNYLTAADFVELTNNDIDTLWEAAE